MRSSLARVLVLTCLLGAGTAAAQPGAGGPPPIRFERLTPRDGLSQGTIHAVLQDRRGFWWFATEDGLNRYDGRSFTIFRRQPFDTTSLGANIVRGLYEDPAGVLWIATMEGLDRLAPGATRFEHIGMKPAGPGDARHLGAGPVFDVAGDRAGGVWVVTFAGLSRLDTRTRRLEHFTRAARTLPSDTALTVYTDPAGTVWAGSMAGLARFDARARTFRRVALGDAVPPRVAVGGILADARTPAVLWIATARGLLRLDTRTGAVVRHATNTGPRRDYPLDLKHDPDDPGVLWITVLRDGLRRFDTRTGRMDAYRHDPADPQSIPDDDLGRIYVDRSGTIWSGAYYGASGAVRFAPAAGRFTEYDSVPRDPTRPQARYVWSVLEDTDGSLWFGTRGPVVTRVDRRTGARRTWTPEQLTGLPPRMMNDPNALLQTRDGALWIGAGALVRLDRATGRLQRFAHDPTDAQSLPAGGVESLLEDAQGRLWVGTRTGLAVLDRANGRFRRVDLGIPPPPVSGEPVPGLAFRALRQDRAGRIWMTTNAGVARYDPRTGGVRRWTHVPGNPATLTANDTYGLLVARDGTVWAGGTYADGLNRIDGRTGRVTHYATGNSGLPSDGVWGIFEDAAGLLWLSTNTAGVVRFDPRTGQFRAFGVAEGAQAQEFNAGAAYQNPRTGEVFFGGVEGVTAFNPAQFTPSRRPPEIALTGLRLFGEPVVPGPDAPLRAPIGEADAVHLRHDQDVVTFEYVGLHAQNPAAIRYRYRLVGFDDRWRTAGTLRAATYTNLDPGPYTFEVQAANADGLWSAPTSVRVTVTPPWWGTAWAYGLYALLLAGAVYGGARLHRRRVVHAEREQAAIREAELRAEAAQARLQAVDKELAVARRIQQAALPNRIASGGATVHGAMAPAREVGGDFYDYFWLDDDRLAFAVGDVAGKGVPAALFMTVARSVLRSVATPSTDPGECLRRANRLLYPERIAGVFVTALYGILDTRTGEAQYACAGHFPPLLVRADGPIESPVKTSGLPLAAVREVAYATSTLQLGAGDVLLAYTDGVVEARAEGGGLFEEDRLLTALAAADASSAEAVVRAVIEAVTAFAAGVPQADDVTALAIRFAPSPAPERREADALLAAPARGPLPRARAFAPAS